MTTHTVEAFGAWLLRASWQGAVLVAAVLAIQWLFRKQLEARWRHALWWLVLARLALPVSPTSPVSFFNVFKAQQGPEQLARFMPSLADATPAGLPQTPPPVPFVRQTTGLGAQQGRPLAAPNSAPALLSTRNDFQEKPARTSAATVPRANWPRILFVLWCAGAIALTTRIVRSFLRLRSELRRALPVTDAAALALLDTCRAEMRVRTEVTLVQTQAVTTPALCGWWRPRLLLPPGMLAQFSPRELRFVFLHELAHLRRKDIALNWLTALLQIMHWFNPLLWLAFARMRADRELACDALALAHTQPGEKRAYGETIVKLLEGSFTQPAVVPGMVGILEAKEHLRRRIQMIASFRPSRRWGWLAGALLAALGMVCLTDAQNTQETTQHNAAAPTNTLKKLTTITVVDEVTGKPLPDATLSVSSFFPGSSMERRDLQTDANGGAEIFDWPEKTSCGINVFANAEDHVGKVVSWPLREEIPASFIMRMPPGKRVAGVLQNEHGQPVAGVKVNIRRPGNTNPSENIDFHPRLSAATTDTNGRWSLSYVPMDYRKVTLLLTHPDYAVTYREVPMDTATTTNAVLVLKSGVIVRGTVLTSNAVPVSGAEVRELHNFDSRKLTAQTAKDGSYELKGLSPGEISLVAQAENLAPQFKRLEQTSGVAQVNFVLGPGKKFHGRVLNEQGEPIAGAVAQTDWDNQGMRKVAWSTKTDAQGRFEWNAAPDEALLFWFEAEGYEWKRSVLLRPGESDCEIILKRKALVTPRPPAGVKLQGLVTDAQSGESLAEFSVSLAEVRDPGFAPDIRRKVRGQSGQFELTVPSTMGSYLLIVEANGYLPKSLPINSTNDAKTVRFALKKGSGPAGLVLTPSGQPAEAASVVLCTLRDGAYMDHPPAFREGVTRAPMQVTDAQGRFLFSPVLEAHTLIVTHSSGFASLAYVDFEKNTNITLQPWARVEGQLFAGAKPLAGETISLGKVQYRYGDGLRAFAPLSLWLTTETDAAGKFVFEKVPPGECKVAHRLSFRKGKPGTIPDSHGFPFTAAPGATNRVTLGGTGRPVIGKVAVPEGISPINWLQDVHRLTLQLEDPTEKTRPERKDFQTTEAFLKAHTKHAADHRAFWTSEPGRALERAQRTYVPIFAQDGRFRIEDVPPGTYTLVIMPTEPAASSLGPTPMPGQGKPIGAVTNVFTIPEIPGGRTDEPLDLGTLTLVVARHLAPGQTAPSFEAFTLEGKPLKLADYRGKFVLLDFWATWCGPCLAELPYMKTTWETYGKDPRFVMIGLSLDSRLKIPWHFVQTNGMTWVQGFLGDGSRVASDYAVGSIPATFLIGPDGKLLARNLRGESLKAEVGKALQASNSGK